ncbi:putative late blight resistance protein homolog R1A-3 [Nicotiana sylvestris]|uniref:putative late blight resistance protein homolog R1A-3 n=1 Tax=Nicotiana sylvestris TaxID=4096 RepID=UPI00388CE63D
MNKPWKKVAKLQNQSEALTKDSDFWLNTDELRKALYSKRYLILVDDVWEAIVWDNIIGCFRAANNGSRIILTTRNHEVANYARFQSDPLPLRMFNDDESWMLLRKIVFGEERFLPLLKNVGKRIAEKCGQLPLSVALVAGILAEMEKKIECWEQVAKNLSPYMFNQKSESLVKAKKKFGLLIIRR